MVNKDQWDGDKDGQCVREIYKYDPEEPRYLLLTKKYLYGNKPNQTSGGRNGYIEQSSNGSGNMTLKFTSSSSLSDKDLKVIDTDYGKTFSIVYGC